MAQDCANEQRNRWCWSHLRSDLVSSEVHVVRVVECVAIDTGRHMWPLHRNKREGEWYYIIEFACSLQRTIAVNCFECFLDWEGLWPLLEDSKQLCCSKVRWKVPSSSCTFIFEGQLVRYLSQEHSSQQEDKEELVNALVNHDANATVMFFLTRGLVIFHGIGSIMASHLCLGSIGPQPHLLSHTLTGDTGPSCEDGLLVGGVSDLYISYET